MHALDTLEFGVVGSMLAGHCDTPLGESLALAVEPVFDDEAVWFEIGRTAEASDLLDTVPVSIAGVTPVGEQVAHAQKGGVLAGAALRQIGESLRVMRVAKAALEPRKEEAPKLWLLGQRLADVGGIESKILDSLDGDGSVRDEASADLKAARQKIAATAKRITDKIQSYVSGRSRELLSDAVFTKRGGRYVVPLKAENRGKIKGIVHDTSASGQTLFVEPEDVVQLGNLLREAEAAERAEEERVLRRLSEELGEVAEEVLDGLDAAGELDLVLAKARFGHAAGGCVPTKAGSAQIRLRGARHPMLDREEAVPLDLHLGEEFDAILITGPNTGGKTVAIKTVGLAVVMAQCGMMPLADTVRLGVFSDIWADIGDEQSLQQSLSTFSAHIRNIAAAINGLRRGALVLLDEIGAGTDPAEGAALARAMMLKFQGGGAKVLASTHYGELKIFASNAPGFTNASMEFDQKSLRPTYKLRMGVPGASQALKIAGRHGVPKDVIDEARSGVRDEELDVSRMIEDLERAKGQAQAAQGEADRLAHRLRQVEAEAEQKISTAEEARARARADAADELEEALGEIRAEAEQVFESLKSGGGQREIEEARSRLKSLQEQGGERADSLRPAEPERQPPEQPLTKGCTVRIVSLRRNATVLEAPKGRSVQVQAGSIKMKINLTDLEFVDSQGPRAPARRGSKLRAQKGMTASGELHLRQMRAEQATEELERFLDDAVLAGLPSVRIVHGKGEGVLRKITRECLKRHPHVGRFDDADAAAGGQGVTFAELK